MKANVFSIAAAVFLIGATSVAHQADARRVGGVHAGHHVGGHHYYHGGHYRYGHYRPGRWVNGVWIVNGVAASVAVGTVSNCAYYNRKWRETGRIYWRDRYYEACR
jgi:hypothetical protein